MPEEPEFNCVELNSFTEKIIGGVFNMSNTLGVGFLEKVFKNALAIEIKRVGLSVSQQHLVPVYYTNVLVGDYYANLLVENRFLVEFKTTKAQENIQIAQCMNFLQATNMKV